MFSFWFLRRYNICILNLAERGLTDDRLALALSVVPPQVLCISFTYTYITMKFDIYIKCVLNEFYVLAQSIVLLEDIDAAFPRRSDSKSNNTSPTAQHTSSDVTFSGLLNTIDGVASR